MLLRHRRFLHPQTQLAESDTKTPSDSKHSQEKHSYQLFDQNSRKSDGVETKGDAQDTEEEGSLDDTDI